MSGLVKQLKEGTVVPSDSVLKHVARAKIRLQMSDIFYSVILMQMPVIYTDTLPTMATDGTALYINPDFATTLSGDEIKAVFIHEVMHKVFFHHVRRGTRRPQVWNIAADVIINDILRKDGKILPPSALDWADAGTLKRNRAEYSTEILADEMSNRQDQDQDQDQGQEQGQEQGQDQGQDQDPFADKGGTGIVIDAENDNGEPLDAAQISEMERELVADIQNAAQIAKAQGKLPASLAEYVDDLRDGTIDWREQFARFLGKGADNRYDWKRVDKKFIQRGIFAPRRVNEGVGHIVIAVDTSASVSQAEYQSLMAEAKSVCLDVDAEKVTIIYCDTRIAHVDTYDDPTSIEERDLGRYGGGGTNFQPPFDYVYENELDVDSFVYLTDLECSMPHEPDYPVLWVSTTKATADFGTTIHIN